MRTKQDWMELSQDEIDSMADESWNHYEKGGCLCYAHSSSECVCGSYDRHPVKRQPLADGTLPLTIGEFSEFSEMMGYENISEIFYDNKLHFKCFSKGWGIITDVKAILYLAERFDLTEGK